MVIHRHALHNFSFRLGGQDLRDLNSIVEEMQAATSVDVGPSDVLRMPIREDVRRRQAYGPHFPGDIVCRRTESGRAVVTGVRHDWVLRSPTGFEWGYRRAGPSDLALNILFYATGDREFAGRHFERFCDEVAGRIPHRGGVLRVREVLGWVARFRDHDRAREAVSRPEDDGPE